MSTNHNSGIFTLYKVHTNHLLLQLCFKINYHCISNAVCSVWGLLRTPGKLLSGDEQKEF